MTRKECLGIGLTEEDHGMKIGYPCRNLTIGCSSGKTFRLKSYSEERIISTVQDNLRCLLDMCRFNAEHGILFLRITSDLIPFASHPVCRFDWRTFFADSLDEIGALIRSQGMRISMHPDQFTLINSIDPAIFARSNAELAYHAAVLEALGLDTRAKIQIHIGGVYGDRKASIDRFVERFGLLDQSIRQRLIIENDDRRYTLRDCLGVSERTGLPVLFDVLHHEVNGSGESLRQAVRLTKATWSDKDGIPMVDYSSQAKGRKPGVHTNSIDLAHFVAFLEDTRPFDFDVMLEIKDKERSAMKALDGASVDPRLQNEKIRAL